MAVCGYQRLSRGDCLDQGVGQHQITSDSESATAVRKHDQMEVDLL